MPVQYLYDSNGYLTGTLDSPFIQPNSTTQEPLYPEGARPRFVNGAWVDPSTPPKVGPIAFQMLFTAEEAEAAASLKASDGKLASFWKLIDDPRTDVVDLSLQTVQGAVEYTLMAVKASGVDVDVPTRKEQILSGVVL